jgi:DNA-directed RNA polymerase subunit beta
VVRTERDGHVVYVDAERILVSQDKLKDLPDGEKRLEAARALASVQEYVMRKFVGLNERTCLNQKPIVQVGQRVKKGQIMADGAATHQGELSLGRNVLVAFMSWDGYNFEDAIIISERLVKNDTYTSIHIEEFEIEIRETKLGKEEFTRDIPNVSTKALGNLDDNGIVRIGTFVNPGDILVGKVSPKSKSELTPEEKLLHAIFGRAGEDVKNDSLEVPSGVEGIVIDAQRFSRRASMSEDEKKAFDKEHKKIEERCNEAIANQFKQMVADLGEVLEKRELKPITGDRDNKALAELAATFKLDQLDLRTPEKVKESKKVCDLRRHQARAFGRRQNGRPARQQGRYLQGPARGGHALPRRRHPR